MAQPILLKRSSVAGKAPTTANLQYGELSINYTDGKLYYLTSNNTINSFSSNGSSFTGDVVTANSVSAGNLSSANIALATTTTSANVTQATSKTTTVTANGSNGTIIMNDANFPHATMVSFTVNNSYILHYNDLVIVNIQNPVTAGQYQATVGAVNPGSFVINVYNAGAGSAQDRADAIVLTFGVIRIGS
jgi:hypothetical protein